MSEHLDVSGMPADGIDIGEQATEFLQRRRYWNWTAENEAELEAWLDQSLAHRVAYLRLEAGLNRAERLVVLRSSTPARRKLPGLPVIARTAVATLAVVALGLGASLYAARPHGDVYATAVGGHEIVSLGDGSKIELNTNTVVRADVDATHRTASIEKGEAYFQIAHDENSPFVVSVHGHRITVLGTKFTVRADAGRTEVALFEGRVWFSGGGEARREKTALLTPGDVLVSTANATSIVKKSDRDLYRNIGWRHDVLIFANSTLAEAAAEFNRYNTQQIVIADAAAANLRIGGTFQSKHVEDFTHLAQAVLGLHVETRGSRIVISH